MNIKFVSWRALVCTTISAVFLVCPYSALATQGLPGLKHSGSEPNILQLSDPRNEVKAGDLLRNLESAQAYVRKKVDLRQSQLNGFNPFGVALVARDFFEDFFDVFENNSLRDFFQQRNINLPPELQVDIVGAFDVDVARTMLNMYITGCLLVRFFDQYLQPVPFVIDRVGKISLDPIVVAPGANPILIQLAQAKKDFAVFVNHFFRCMNTKDKMMRLTFNVCDGEWPPQIEIDKYDSDAVYFDENARDPNTVLGTVLILSKIGNNFLRQIRELEEQIKRLKVY